MILDDEFGSMMKELWFFSPNHVQRLLELSGVRQIKKSSAAYCL